MADKTIRGPFGANKPITSQNVGTVAAGSAVVEYGDGVNHQTVITVDTTLGAIASGAHGYGKLIYSFPDGSVLNVKGTYMSMALTASEVTIAADTPDIGVGTVTATGETGTTLTSTLDDIMPGQTANDCDGTNEVIESLTALQIATAGGHDVYFNAADTWAGTDTGCAIAGTIIIEWTFVV